MSYLTPHAGHHIPGAEDALPWTTIHGKGLHSARPAAASTNAGYVYYETDTTDLFLSDGSAWTKIASVGLTVASAVTSGGALATNKHTPADVTSGGFTLTLPTGQTAGTVIGVEKVDSTTNIVTVSGSIRGVGAQTMTLSLFHEIVQFVADSSGSWWPWAGHKTLSSLETHFKRVYNVQEYGAKGDNGTTPDNSAAFNAAIKACSANGGELYIPEGYYYFTAPIDPLTKPMVVRGAGYGLTNLILNYDAASTRDYFLGVNVAGLAPTFGTVAAGGSVDVGWHYYAWTYTINGVESTPSVVAAIQVTSGGTQTVPVTIPAAPSANVTIKTLYRSKAAGTTATVPPDWNTGGGQANWGMVSTTATNGSVTINDTTADASLTAVSATFPFKRYSFQLCDFAIYPAVNQTAGSLLRLGNVGQCNLEGAKIVNNGSAKPWTAIRVDEGSEINFIRVKVNGTGSDAIVAEVLIDAMKRNVVELVFGSDCVINNLDTRVGSTDGIYLHNANTHAQSTVEGIHLNGCTLYGHSGWAIYAHAEVGTIRNLHMIAPVLDTCYAGGVYCTGAGRIETVLFQDVWSSVHPNGPGLQLDSNVVDFFVDSGVYILSGSHGMIINGAKRGTIGNSFNANNSQNSNGTTVTHAIITGGGTGYPASGTVTFTGGGGTGATGTYVATGGVIQYIVITNMGTGYTSAPAVSFSGSPTLAATGNAYLSNAYGINILNGASGITVEGNKVYNSPKNNYPYQFGIYVDSTAFDIDLKDNFCDTQSPWVTGGTNFRLNIQSTTRTRSVNNLWDSVGSTGSTAAATQGVSDAFTISNGGTTGAGVVFRVGTAGQIATMGFGFAGVLHLGGFSFDGHLITNGSSKPNTNASAGRAVIYGGGTAGVHDIQPQNALTEVSYLIAAPQFSVTANNVTTVSGVQAWVNTVSGYTGTITSTAAFHAKTGTFGGSVAPATQYGLLIDSLSGGTANVGVYVAGTNPSMFGGKVSVGQTATPTAYLFLPASAGGANTNVAPIKITAGTLMTTAEAGGIENDGTGLYYTTAGAKRRVLNASSGALTASTSAVTTTETVVATMAAATSDLNVAGRRIRCRLFGRYTTTAAASPTFTARVRLGGLTGTVLYNTVPATTALTVSLTDAPIMLEFVSTVRTTGTSGTLFTNGIINVASAAAGAPTLVASPQYPTAAITANLTTLADWVVTIVTNASTTSVTIDQAEIEVL